MPSFYFEQLLQTGLNGIDQQGITAAVLQIAGVILILSLLWAVYEAYTSGGDVRLLGVAAVKYLVLGLVFLNYQSAFRAVNGMFNGVADDIYNLSGGVDVIKAWGNSMSQAWSANPNWASTLWGLVTGGISVAIGAVIAVVGYLLLPFTYTLFTLFYALYGSILYVVGPFVLALMPSRSLGQLGRSFFVNVMIFQCWGLLYAILQSLMSALQITDPMQFSGSFLQAFVGSSQVIVMSVASVLLSIMIALIPFIASRIVRGDIGSTLMTVISGAATAGAVASGLAFAGGEGLAAGRMVAPEGPPPPPTAGPSGVSQNTGSASQGSVVGQAHNAGTGPLPLQLLPWILQPRQGRDRRPPCGMPTPAKCLPGTATVGKNPVTRAIPQAVRRAARAAHTVRRIGLAAMQAARLAAMPVAALPASRLGRPGTCLAKRCDSLEWVKKNEN